jgi:hypothetical protein
VSDAHCADISRVHTFGRSGQKPYGQISQHRPSRVTFSASGLFLMAACTSPPRPAIIRVKSGIGEVLIPVSDPSSDIEPASMDRCDQNPFNVRDKAGRADEVVSYQLARVVFCVGRSGKFRESGLRRKALQPIAKSRFYHTHADLRLWLQCYCMTKHVLESGVQSLYYIALCPRKKYR